MDMSSANRCRYFQELRPPSSACFARAGEVILAIAYFVSIARRLPKCRFKKACFGATPKPSTRDACAAQARVFALIIVRILRTQRVGRAGVPELRQRNAVSR